MASLRRGSVLLVLAPLLLSGCSGGSPEGATIGRAQNITLYEGLPHPFYETAALETEKKSKPTVELHGFAFYRETPVLKVGDQEKLKAILGSPRSFKRYSGEKKCGGFHPDYAVGWTIDGAEYVCLICFGCYEFRIYGPGGQSEYDIPRETGERLKHVLTPYRKNRPPFPHLEP